jgi:hypothetical protein
MSDVKTAAQPLEFFSLEVQSPPKPRAGKPPFMGEMIYRSEEDKAAFSEAAPEFLGNLKLAIAFFPDCGLNLAALEFAPGFLLPLHSHRADCLYYVEQGSVVMGSRELGPGEGFLVRGDRPYGYSAGPKGVRILEFRSERTADLTLHERNVPRWRQRFLRAFGQP